MSIELNEASFLKVASWGQYVHWAELQFRQFRILTPESNEAAAIGLAAHWLAAEYVVLEGWEKMKLEDARIASLLSHYPEHRDALRRCRNAVYHFQAGPLDPRLSAYLADKNEELRWCAALHHEFQRYLLAVAATFNARGAAGRELVDAMTGAIGWFPRHPLEDQLQQVRELCLRFEQMLAEDDNPVEAKEAREFLDATRRQIASLDLYPLPSLLSRSSGVPHP